MAYLGLVTDVFEVDKKYTSEELFHKLHKFCDSDFNGDNGEDYYRVDGEVSDLEHYINESIKQKDTLKKLISTVVEANYEYDSYYQAYEIEFIERDNLLIVSVAIVSD